MIGDLFDSPWKILIVALVIFLMVKLLTAVRRKEAERPPAPPAATLPARWAGAGATPRAHRPAPAHHRAVPQRALVLLSRAHVGAGGSDLGSRLQAQANITFCCL